MQPYSEIILNTTIKYKPSVRPFLENFSDENLIINSLRPKPRIGSNNKSDLIQYGQLLSDCSWLVKTFDNLISDFTQKLGCILDLGIPFV